MALMMAEEAKRIASDNSGEVEGFKVTIAKQIKSAAHSGTSSVFIDVPVRRRSVVAAWLRQSGYTVSGEANKAAGPVVEVRWD